MKSLTHSPGRRAARLWTSRFGAAACISAVVLFMSGCGGSGGGTSSRPPGGGANPATRTVSVSTESVAPGDGSPNVKATTLFGELEKPWGLAFLPDGGMLVTQKGGQMVIVRNDGNQSTVTPVAGNVPAVASDGQGGLLDVQVDPASTSGETWVYWTFSEPGSGPDAGKAGTAVARGRLIDDSLQDISVIFRQVPKVNGGNHFGSRLVFRGDGTLFVALGERFQDQPDAPTYLFAQNLETHLGKVVRINKDGSAASGNPYVGVPNALPEIWSLGHRNPQGAALHPETGELWVSEHGPRGGDEVNIAASSKNYGWPLRSYGCPYTFPEATDSCRVGGGNHQAAGFVEPLTTWLPVSSAPSGMAFYTGAKLREWQGNLFVGALASKSLWKLTVSADRKKVDAKQELFKNDFGRIRDVRQGRDGWLYLLTDESSTGKLIRIER